MRINLLPVMAEILCRQKYITQEELFRIKQLLKEKCNA